MWTSIILFPNILYALTSSIITPIYRYANPSYEQKLLLEIKEMRNELKTLRYINDEEFVVIEKKVYENLLKEKNI